MIKSLRGLSVEQLLALDPNDVRVRLDVESIIYPFMKLGGYWEYREGNPYHAELNSGLCSDGFFYSSMVLQYDNLCRLYANQLVARYVLSGLDKPAIVYGIPNGAKTMGEYVADGLGAKRGDMAKLNGRLVLLDMPEPGESVLFVDDVSTQGTRIVEAEEALFNRQPDADLVPIVLMILNRGGFSFIDTPRTRIGSSALADRLMSIYKPGKATCPRCAVDSRPIKPKATDENWWLINQFNYEHGLLT